MIAAKGADHLCFFIITNGADDRRPKAFRPLAHNLSDAARGGMDQDRIACFDRIGLADQILCGHALQHHRRCRFIVDTVGNFDGCAGCHQAFFGIGPRGRPGISNPVTDS